MNTPESKRAISRRALMMTALGGSLGLGIASQIPTLAREVRTATATFVPLYANHNVGLNPTDIPDDLDAIFIELISPNLYTNTPIEILMAVGRNTEKRILSADILEKLASRQIKIMFGDLETDTTETTESVLRTKAIESELGIFGLGTASWLLLKGITDQKQESKNLLSRRSLLGLGLAAIGFWGLSWPLILLESGHPSSNQSSATQRVIDRLQALQSHAHPEDTIIFLRNTLIANKLLTAAQTLQQKSNGNPIKIGFNVGAAHTGIEDMLRAGPDICRFLINSYPTFYIKDIVTQPEGIKNFCTIRMFSLPPDYKDIDLNNWQNETDNQNGGSDPNVLDGLMSAENQFLKQSGQIKEERIIDTILFQQLTQKLS